MKKTSYNTEENRYNSKIDFNNPPAGKTYIPIPVTWEFVQDADLDRQYVTMYHIHDKRELCFMLLVDDDGALDFYEQELKNERHQEVRKNRCIIESPITGKAIACPDENSCYGCVKYRLNTVTARTESIDQLQEDVGLEAADPHYTINGMIMGMIREEFTALLREEDPMLLDIFRMQDQGFRSKEIMSKLGLSKSTFYRYRSRIQDIYNEYDNNLR